MGREIKYRRFYLQLDEAALTSDGIRHLSAKGELLLYLRLLLKAASQQGRLVFVQDNPILVEQLAYEFGVSAMKIQQAITLYAQLGLVVCDPLGIYFPNWEEITGSETYAAVRMRKKRAFRNNVTEKCNNVTEKCNNVTDRAFSRKKQESGFRNNVTDIPLQTGEENTYSGREDTAKKSDYNANFDDE